MFIKKLVTFSYRFWSLKSIFLVALVLLLLLLYKSVFSERTLIPNFDPHPDTFHYVVPARSFAQGLGFGITREGRSFAPSVPPGYSTFLIPFYLINNDARMYYFANVVLSLISLVVFYLIIKRLTKNIFLVGLSLFVYVSNYYIYWVPSLAMSENLVLPLFLVSLLLLIEKTKPGFMMLFLVTSLGLYVTKYANAPIFGSFLFLYFLKILNLPRGGNKSQKIRFFLIGFVVTVFLMFLLNIKFSGFNPFSTLLSIFANTIFPTGLAPENVTSLSGSWFSRDYFSINFMKNLKSLLGGPERFVWDFTPIVSKFVSMLGIVGLVWSLFQKKFRFISFAIIILIFSELIFISFFYAIDMRYMYHAIPALILGFTLFWIHLDRTIGSRKIIFYILIFAVGTFMFLTSVTRLKNQIVLNLKYAEVPWAYVSIKNLNNYFSKTMGQGAKPIVISPQPPYLVDFYSNNNYSLLPLSKVQEFRSYKNQAWGEHDYEDLITLYKNYLNQGRDLYVSTYGLGNEGYLHQDFEKIQENFKLKLIYDECYSQCRLYSIHNK